VGLGLAAAAPGAGRGRVLHVDGPVRPGERVSSVELLDGGVAGLERVVLHEARPRRLPVLLDQEDVLDVAERGEDVVDVLLGGLAGDHPHEQLRVPGGGRHLSIRVPHLEGAAHVGEDQLAVEGLDGPLARRGPGEDHEPRSPPLLGLPVPEDDGLLHGPVGSHEVPEVLLPVVPRELTHKQRPPVAVALGPSCGGGVPGGGGGVPGARALARALVLGHPNLQGRGMGREGVAVVEGLDGRVRSSGVRHCHECRPLGPLGRPVPEDEDVLDVAELAEQLPEVHLVARTRHLSDEEFDVH